MARALSVTLPGLACLVYSSPLGPTAIRSREVIDLGAIGPVTVNASEATVGQQQRVALARALAYDPPVLLMDESLSALEKKLRDELQSEIRRIHRQTGVTILYLTHDQDEALRMSDRIAMFSRGRIEQFGIGAELYRAPADLAPGS